MNTKITGLFILALLVGMSSCVSSKKFKELEEEKNQLEESVTELGEKVDMLSSENQSLSSENATLGESLSTMESQLAETQMTIDRVEKDLKKSQSELTGIKTDLRDAFSAADEAAKSNQAKIKEMEDKLYLEVDDGIHFNSGSAYLQGDDVESLQKIADMLKSAPGMHLIIEGHTDNVPIYGHEKYKDNWDLSVARSVAIVRKLVKMGVNPAQLTAAGGGEHHPVSDNDSADGRKANRRGDVIIIPKIGKIYKNYKQNP